jgi:hypothetical protein
VYKIFFVPQGCGCFFLVYIKNISGLFFLHYSELAAKGGGGGGLEGVATLTANLLLCIAVNSAIAHPLPQATCGPRQEKRGNALPPGQRSYDKCPAQGHQTAFSAPRAEDLLLAFFMLSIYLLSNFRNLRPAISKLCSLAGAH